ncbi:MAG: hypothetical protein ACF788_09790, partial [Novipirellula sp. JB048]
RKTRRVVAMQPSVPLERAPASVIARLQAPVRLLGMLVSLLSLLSFASWMPRTEAAQAAQAAQAAEAAASDDVAAAAGVTLTSSIDRATAKLLEPIELTLTVVAPVEVAVDFQPVPETLGAFQVVSANDSPAVPIAGEGAPIAGEANPARRRWTRRLVLETLQLGELEIPPIEVAYARPDSAAAPSGVLRSDPITVQIQSVLTSDDQPQAFRPMKDKMPVASPPPPTDSQNGMLAILIAVLGLGGLALILHRRRQREAPAAIALRRLSALHARRDSPEFDPRDGYVESAEIARDFVMCRDGMNPAVMTTDQVIRYLTSECELPEGLQQRLVELLLAAERCKFAPPRPGESEWLEKLDQAERLVRELVERSLTVRRRAVLGEPVVGSDKEAR